MLMKSKRLSEYLRDTGPNGLIMVPTPDLAEFEKTGAASIDLRLGRWFITFRPTRLHRLEVAMPGQAPANEAGLTKTHYVPFGGDFTLHPGSFCPGNNTGMVTTAPQAWRFRWWKIVLGTERADHRDSSRDPPWIFRMLNT